MAMARPIRTSSRGAPYSPRRSLYLSLLFCIYTLFTAPAVADCECGYSATIGTDTDVYVFTDLIESNFASIPDISKDTDWVRQAFNMTNVEARGDYGEMFSVDNVFTSASTSAEGNRGVLAPSGNDTLELTVQAGTQDGMVSGAEIDTSRLDVFWGTFRASMKMTNVSGTCAAWFWYYNDTEEIDMEFLSREYSPNNQSYPVNLVLQSREALEAGYNAQGTGNFVQASLPFDPTLDFHEYRFDYLPGRVFFYADGQLLAEMNGSAVPAHAGHLILQHWSNGNPLWSGGPPTQDAVVSVNYVKAYFNSSSAARLQDWELRCTDPTAANAVCAIPDIGTAVSGGGNATNSSSGEGSSAGGWFFSGQNNMTNNQTVYSENNGSKMLNRVWRAVALALLLTGGWVLGLW